MGIMEPNTGLDEEIPDKPEGYGAEFMPDDDDDTEG